MEDIKTSTPEISREKAMEIAEIMHNVPESGWDKLKYAAVGMALYAGAPVQIGTARNAV